MNAAARGQITFNEAQKGEDTFYLRLSPSTLAMSNEVTAEDKAVTPSRDWYEKYRASLRLMRGDTNVSGYIIRLRIYDTSGTLVYDSSLSTQPTTGDVLMSALLQNVVNPVTSRGETYYLLNFRKFDAEAPCEGKMDIYVNASIPAEEGSSEMIPFEDYITLSYSVEDNELLLGLEYLKRATSDGRVTTDGGLILSSAIALGEWENDEFTPWAGMSGIYDETLTDPGKSIAAWYGGDIIDYETLTEAQKADPTIRYAQSLFRMDGSGYLAGGGIRWDEDGNLIIDGSVKLASGTGDTLTEFIDVVTDLSNMFEMVPLSGGGYAVRTKNNMPFYSNSWISALGEGSASGGGGGGDGADLSEVWGSLSGHTDDYATEKIDWSHIDLRLATSGSGNVVSDITLTKGYLYSTLTVSKMNISSIASWVIPEPESGNEAGLNVNGTSKTLLKSSAIDYPAKVVGKISEQEYLGALNTFFPTGTTS